MQIDWQKAVSYWVAQFVGAAMNPGRYFGTALASFRLDQIVVYFVGPAVGAILAWAAFEYGLAKK